MEYLHQGLGKLPAIVAVSIVGALSTLYLLYRAALPKPLPGIPYNKAALGRVLGDAAEIMEIRKRGGKVRTWFLQQPMRHKSPMAQAFMAPFAKPMVIVSDFREVHDILIRRGKEFDKGGRLLEAFGGIAPHHSISMATSNPQFKANRELVKDLMTPKFLNERSAPEIHQSTVKFIDLWRLKAELAKGVPFDAKPDIYAMSFDTIRNVALGEGETISMVDQHMKDVESSANTHTSGAFQFPKHQVNEELAAYDLQFDAVAVSMTKPSPKTFHKSNNKKPALRNSFMVRDTKVNEAIAIATRNSDENREIRSAADFVARREINLAAKEKRQPDLHSPYLKSELFGYIAGGLETVSSVLYWGLKYLTANPDAQAKLRAAMREAYPAAVQERRQVRMSELTKTPVPYLEAVVEEIARLAAPIRTVFRVAQVDTTILGRHIPKGTNVLLATYGPGVSMPGFEDQIDEASRSTTARANKGSYGAWERGTEHLFEPERWIRTDEDGTQHFNPQAGPALAFGGGIRGCYGRRLAYVHLRIAIALLVWNLEFLDVPEDKEGDSFEPLDGFTIQPTKCFVRLAAIEL